MSKLLAPLLAEVRKSAKELGFTGRGSFFLKQDALVRAIQIATMQKGSGFASFDLLFDLGIPGISNFTPKAREWGVRCYGKNVPLDSNLGVLRFSLVGDSGDEAVVEAASSCLQRACDNFLMLYENPGALYRFVSESALQFVDLGMELDDEFRRLRLEPWNVMKRLELAGVYASFLGLRDDANSVEAAARRYVESNKDLQYLLPEIQGSITAARRRFG